MLGRLQIYRCFCINNYKLVFEVLRCSFQLILHWWAHNQRTNFHNVYESWYPDTCNTYKSVRLTSFKRCIRDCICNLDNTKKLYKSMILKEIFLKLFAIYKPRHWNLCIGIGTDITNAIVSSSIKPMDTKRSRVVT